MPRRSKRQPENHERWLVSYADFVTLLFAFFVVMFATSRVDSQRMRQISEFYSAFLARDAELVQHLLAKLAEQDQTQEAAASTPDARRVLTMAELTPIKEQVQQRLASLLEAEKIGLSLTPRGLIISLRESGFFPPGQAAFLPGTADLLAEVGAVIAELPNQPVRMEGHTDNTPIRTPRFPSNWELSAARAIAVLDLMVERFDIDPRRVSVAGYGERRPIADNATPEGRAKNRRVDIAILSQSAAEMAPKQRLDNLDEPGGVPGPAARNQPRTPRLRLGSAAGQPGEWFSYTVWPLPPITRLRGCHAGRAAPCQGGGTHAAGKLTFYDLRHQPSPLLRTAPLPIHRHRAGLLDRRPPSRCGRSRALVSSLFS